MVGSVWVLGSQGIFVGGVDRTKPAEHPQIRFLKADRQIRQDTVPGLSVGLRGLDDITAI